MATISGTSGSDTLTGTSGNDTLNGLGGNDMLVGSAGTDFYDGGAGFDTLDLRLTTAGVTVSFASATISGGFSGSFANIERVLAGNGSDSLIGAAGAQELSGRKGSDTLAGGPGNDILWGGVDADSFVFRETGTANADSIGDFASGSDKIVLDGSVMTALGASGNFAAGDARFAANSAGTAQDASDRVIFNTSTGQIFYDADGNGSGAAVLIATLQSGATLAATDIVVENGGSPSGGQTINGTSGNDSLAGGTGNDTINGFGGNDTLDGGAGADSMVGGPGDDLYIVDNPGDVIVEQVDGGVDRVDASVTYTLPAWVNWLTLTGTAAINGTGNEVDNLITGNSADNSLAGGGGDDSINGGGGSNFLDGGDGNDLLRDVGVDSPDEGGDMLIGGAGNDTLDGENHRPGGRDANVDTLDGGLGDDRYYVDNHADVLSDAGGVDTVVVFNMRWTLAPGFEHLVLVNENGFQQEYGIGNNLDNHMSGGAGVNLEGRGGNDTLVGGGPSLRGEEGNDLITAENSGTFLFGGEGHDTLNGGAGTTTMDGGTGNDVLTGGDATETLGGDVFWFSETPGAANADLITDFKPGINTILLDGNAHTNLGSSGRFVAGDARFAANSSGSAQDSSDRVIYNSTTGELWYDADGSGAGAAALIATLRGAPALAASDIQVINGGTSSDQVINGTSGADALHGSFGNDTINGLGGDDSIDGGGGNDSILGGDGDDRLNGDVDDPDAAFGDDYIDGGAGNDRIQGWRGDDTLLGGPGDDGFTIGTFSQSFSIHPGNDFIDGGDGIDSISFGTGWVVIDLQAGTYRIADHRGEVNGIVLNVEDVWADGWIKGTNGPNRLQGESNSTIEGRGGDDFISLIWGVTALLHGGAGNDTITIDEGGASLVGGEGNDVLTGADDFSGDRQINSFVFDVAPGAANADLIDRFEAGQDKIVLDGNVHSNIGPSGNFTAGDARFFAGAGASSGQDASDRVIYNTITGELWYDADGNGAGSAQLIATVEGAPALSASNISVINGAASGGAVINGTSGSDTLQGGAGNDTLNGLGGNDTLVGSGGSDFYEGGAGSDTLDLRATNVGVTVDFGSGTISGSFSGTFVSMERVLSGNGADILLGAAGGQTLSARGGDDTLAGGAGNDALWGGGGADAFVFREMGTANADQIGDFSSGSDKLHLDDAAFTAIGAMGNFAAADARFKANSSGTATDTNDRVVFNTSTGQLYYDADGSGSGAAQLIATVQSGATVAATDIMVI